MCEYCGIFIELGCNSFYCDCLVEENFDLFVCMKVGEFFDGVCLLWVKIDMGLLNMNLCDLILYCICYVYYYQIGDKWCIYLSYDFIYGQLDVIEGIIYLICILEFEDYCLFYEWFLVNLLVFV